jgi:hypothetical protein
VFSLFAVLNVSQLRLSKIPSLLRGGCKIAAALIGAEIDHS